MAKLKRKFDLEGTLKSLKVGESIEIPRADAKIETVRSKVSQMADYDFSVIGKDRINDCLVVRVS